ncbi:MAG: wax ester/triacylglycerol synthase domain-containing protein, partial [Cyclonatronaceae bacterium]
MSSGSFSQHLPTEVMSGADSAWLRMEQPENQMSITGIMYLAPKPDMARLRRLIERRLLRYDRFRQIATGRNSIPLWEPDPAFDINYHLREVRLRRDTPARSVQEYVGEILSTPLDFSRPLWHMRLLEESEEAGRAILVLKLHHCIADGIGLVRILLSLARVHPDGPYFEPHKEYQPKRQGTGGIGAGALHTLAGSVGKIYRGLYKFLSMPADTHTHLKGALQIQKKAAWSPLLPLPVVKQLAARYHATINDILLWFVSNALRAY